LAKAITECSSGSLLWTLKRRNGSFPGPNRMDNLRKTHS
jgi:hypothetical protein